MLPENERHDQSNFTTTTEDEDEKTCLKCRHLTEGWSFDIDCIKQPWCRLPDEVIESDTWHIDCPQHCGSFEAIAAGGVA